LLPLSELFEKTPLIGLEIGGPSGVLGDMLVELVDRKLGDRSSRNGHDEVLFSLKLVNLCGLATRWL
jgi:hypothetical protein